MYDKETAQAVLLSLKSGESLKKRITPLDVFFFVLKGQADILIEEETQNIDANSLVKSLKDIVHCISNNTHALVRVLVLKTPLPSSANKIL